MIDIPSAAEFIRQVQKPDGEIPWSKGGKTDPWDHIESAMGLTIGGFFDEARKAYQWAAETQLPDGSWWSCYEGGRPARDAYKDSNMTAYIGVGALHYYLSTGDPGFPGWIWPTVRRAMDYVTHMQGNGGEIFWAKRADGSVDRRALLTGSSSIYKSLSSAIHIALLLEEDTCRWMRCMESLKIAIRSRPWLFDQSKSHYAMDWYYPVLSGAVTGRRAFARIERLWNAFIIPEWGVRCVSDRPWVTIAETAELVATLAAIGRPDAAEKLLGWIADNRYDDGAFWTGVTYPDRTIYTREKTTWTAAAVLLANDILYGVSPSSRLFSHESAEPGTPDRPVSENAPRTPFPDIPN